MGWKGNLAIGAGVVAASLLALAIFRKQIVGGFSNAGSTIGTGAGSFLGNIGSSFVSSLESYLPGGGLPSSQPPGSGNPPPGQIPAPGTPGTQTGNPLIPPPDVSSTLNNNGQPKGPPPGPVPGPNRYGGIDTTPAGGTVTPGPAVPGPAAPPPKPAPPAPGSTFRGLPGQYGTPIPGLNLVDQNAIHGSMNAYEYLLHEQSQQSPLLKPTLNKPQVNVDTAPSNDIFSQIARALESGLPTIIPGVPGIVGFPRGTPIAGLEIA